MSDQNPPEQNAAERNSAEQNAPKPSTPSQSTAQSTAPVYRKRSRSSKALIITIAVLAIAAIVAILVFLQTRGQGGSEAGAGGGANGGAASTRGELVVGLTLEPTNLDIRSTGGVALDQILIDNIYQGLIGLSPGTVDEFVPVLAEALPKVSDDGLSYTFALRDGVSFHSGSALTADDVVASYEATLTEALLGAPATVAAPDARTIEITLTEANSQLLWHLANRPGLVFEAADTSDLASSANGTGPYVLDTWKQGDSITFVANPDYWGEPATLDSVVWRYLPDGNAAVNAALEGDVDVLAPVVPSLASRLDGDAEYELVRANSTDVFTLGFNTQKAPLDDPRVRTALSQAIEGDAIVEAFYGDGKTLGGPITDLEPAYEDLTGVHPYDPKGARALLAEAGVPNLTLTLTVPNFYDPAPINQIVTQLAEVGVTLQVNSVEFGAWLTDVYSAPEDGSPRTFDVSYIDHAEANDFVNYTNPGYYFGYDNPEVQSLYAQSIAATDSEQAIDLVKQAARLVAADAPAKWLINYTPTNAVGTHVSGFPSSNTNSRISLEGVSIIEE